MTGMPEISVETSRSLEEDQPICESRYKKNPGYYLYSQSNGLHYDGTQTHQNPRISYPTASGSSFTSTDDSSADAEDEKHNFRIEFPL